MPHASRLRWAGGTGCLRGDTIEQAFGLKSSDAELLDDEVKTGHRHLRCDCYTEIVELFRIVADSRHRHNNNVTMMEDEERMESEFQSTILPHRVSWFSRARTLDR